MAELVVAYEPEHADTIATYVRDKKDAQVIALDFWAERALDERGVQYRSITSYPHGRASRTAYFRLAQDFCRQWYRLPEFSFFEYKGVRIGESAELMILNQAERVLLYVALLEPIVASMPDCTEIVMPRTATRLPPKPGALHAQELTAPVDAGEMLAASRRLRFTALGEPFILPAFLSQLREKRTWRHSVLSILNRIIAVCAPRRPIKIFASEYWRHIAPIMEKAHDVELVIMDRNQFSVVPWRAIWQHRIRFIHPQDVLSRPMIDLAHRRAEEFRRGWTAAIPAIESLAQRLSQGVTDVTWWPIVIDGIATLIEEYAPRMVAEAEGIEYILKDERIDKVLLRASMGGRQHHFFTTCCLAHNLNIPSIELQHGGGEFDPRSAGARFAASYLAAYGSMTRALYIKNFNIEPERIRVVGSPRFDRYITIPRLKGAEREARCCAFGLDPARPIVLGAVPAENTGAALDPQRLDSYDVAEFFRMAAAVRKHLPAAQFIFKFRENGITRYHRQFLDELLPEGGYVATDGGKAQEKADFFSLLQIADVAVSGKSTVIFETMIVGLPLVCFQWRTDDIHREIYRELGPMTDTIGECAARLVQLLSDKQLYDDTARRQRTFLDTNFLFDGRAAERVAALLREPLTSFPARFD